MGSRMGPYINRAPIRDSRATRRAPAGDYMLRAALVVTYFFLGENRPCRKLASSMSQCLDASQGIW